jgi:lipoprotein releasing system LolC/E family transmembrane protein
MSVEELFHQAALINAMICFWLASAVTATRLMLRGDAKVSTALSTSLLLGPLAFVGSWFFYRRQKVKMPLPKAHADNALQSRSALSIVLVALLLVISLHFSFVKSSWVSTLSSEVLLRRIAFALCLLPFLGGLVLAAITSRVAFFESCWTTAFFAAYIFTLKEWAETVFSYGNSAAYFSVLIFSASSLVLIFLSLGGALGYLLFGEGRLNSNFGYESFVGLRFLMTKRSSHVVSMITVISIFAVSIAVAGMIVVMGVMNGFTDEFRSKILGANAHLMVMKYGRDFTEYGDILEKTKKISGVVSLSPFVLNEGMVSSKRNLSGALIAGIDVGKEKPAHILQYVDEQALDFLKDPTLIPITKNVDHNTGFSIGQASEGKNDLPGVIVGKEMAGSLQVFVGDVISLISPVGDLGPTGPIPKAKSFRVAGLFHSGMYEYDAKFAYIRLEDAQEFFNLKSSVSGIEYRVKNIDDTRKIAQEIDGAIGGYPFYTRDWMQMNRPIFSALQLEKIAMLVILGTLICMASLLILVTLIMVVIEKGKEIAILKSMGATDTSIMKIFVTYGLFVGGIGAILGGLLGFTTCILVERIGIRIDPDVYYFSQLPVKVDLTEMFLVVFLAILVSFLATIPPALFAARLKPVEGLRYE